MNKQNQETDLMEDWNRYAFGLRLARLRQQRNRSARQMSLDLGQNKNYINSIETGKNFPTMEGFLNICDYLHIAPDGFFRTQEPERLFFPYLEELLSQLNDTQLHHLYQLAEDLVNSR